MTDPFYDNNGKQANDNNLNKQNLSWDSKAHFQILWYFFGVNCKSLIKPPKILFLNNFNFYKIKTPAWQQTRHTMFQVHTQLPHMVHKNVLRLSVCATQITVHRLQITANKLTERHDKQIHNHHHVFLCFTQQHDFHCHQKKKKVCSKKGQFTTKVPGT